MVTLNIQKETKIELNSEGIEKLQAYLDEPASRTIKRRLIITTETYPYTSLIYNALNIDKDDFGNMIKIVPNIDGHFGEVTVEDTDMFRGNRTESDDFIVLQNNIYGDATKLNETITMQNPDYLIMSASTWNFLNQVAAFSSDVDSYPINGVAYYHSYHKISVAICELLDFGRIDLV